MRYPRLVPFGAVMLLVITAAAGMFAPGSRSTADAYNLCDPRGYCGSLWFIPRVEWTDATGWTGSRASAISASGTPWHLASQLDVIQYQGQGPVNASVQIEGASKTQPPGRTVVYWSPSNNYEIIGAYTYLNTAWTWYTDGTMNYTSKLADVRTVTMHEMGHWMLLNHDGAHPEAVMWPVYVTKWYLATDDSDGMLNLYPFGCAIPCYR